MMTLVTDIEKSSLFAGYDAVTGQALFNLPISSVRITTEDQQEGMSLGEFFQVREHDQVFEEYHRFGEEEFGLNNDVVQRSTNAFASQNPHALPPTRYIINAPTDLYRRIVDEISSSASLPCGLFFCGHHEDVAKPSLMIPFIVLTCFFGLMGLVAYMYRD